MSEEGAPDGQEAGAPSFYGVEASSLRLEVLRTTEISAMPVVTLPDGSQRRFDHPVTVDEVAGGIGAGLRKAALAARVNGKLVDTSYLIA